RRRPSRWRRHARRSWASTWPCSKNPTCTSTCRRAPSPRTAPPPAPPWSWRRPPLSPAARRHRAPPWTEKSRRPGGVTPSQRGPGLPIGGGRERVRAAARAGITPVLLPARKQKAVEAVPEAARAQVRCVWLERVADAVAAALNPPGAREEAEAPAGGETQGRRAARSA